MHLPTQFLSVISAVKILVPLCGTGQNRRFPLPRKKGMEADSNIIAGRHPVMEALRSGTSIEKIFILYGVRGKAIEKIRSFARQRNVPCIEVSQHKLRELVNDTATQGVAAIVGLKEYVEVEDLLAVSRERGEQRSEERRVGKECRL